jgi:hypothetical protein
MINILPIWQGTLLHEYYIYITIFGFSFQVGQVSCQVSVPAVIVITENISPSRVTSNKFYNNKRKTINLTILLNMRRSVVLSQFLATIVYSGQVFASSDAARFASHFVFAARSAAEAFQTTAACRTNVLHPLAGTLTSPAARDLDGLSGGGALNKIWPAGFRDPFGPSVLCFAFNASTATAFTTIAFTKGYELFGGVPTLGRVLNVCFVDVSVRATLLIDTCILLS